MPGNMEEFESVLGRIDDLIGPSEPIQAAPFHAGSIERDIRNPYPTVLSTEHPLAKALSEVTGLPTVVTEENPGDTAEQLAHQAAMAAIAHFGPARISEAAGRAIKATERGEK